MSHQSPYSQSHHGTSPTPAFDSLQSKTPFKHEVIISNNSTDSHEQLSVHPGFTYTGSDVSFGLYPGVSTFNTNTNSQFSSLPDGSFLEGSSVLHGERTLHAQSLDYRRPSNYVSANLTSSDKFVSYISPAAYDYTRPPSNSRIPNVALTTSLTTLSETVSSVLTSEMELRHEETSSLWNKSLTEISGVDFIFKEKAADNDYENQGEQKGSFFGGKVQFFQANQRQKPVCVSKGSERDLSIRGQGRQLPAVEEYEQRTSNNMLFGGVSGMFPASNAYRSFSSELNSPDLPLTDDPDVDFEFPVHLGLEENGFDSFLLSEQNGDVSNSNEMRNGSGSFRYSTGCKDNSEFPSTTANAISNYINNGIISDQAVTSKMKRQHLEGNLLSSESYHSFKYEGERFNCQISDSLAAISQDSGLPSKGVGNPNQQWLGCQSISEVTSSRNHISGNLSNHENSYNDSGNFLDVGNFLNIGAVNENFRNPDVANFRSDIIDNRDYKTLDQVQLSRNSETEKDNFLIRPHTLPYMGSNGYDSTNTWRACNSVEDLGHDRGLWFVRGHDANSGCGLRYPSDTQNGGTEFVEFPEENAFQRVTETNYRGCSSVVNNHLTSKTTLKHDNSGDSSTDNDSYSDNTSACYQTATLSQQNIRTRTNSDTGQIALMKLIQQQNSGTECLDSNLVKSAVAHIMKTRPRASKMLTNMDIFSCSYRNVKAAQMMTSQLAGVLNQFFDDSEGEGESVRKRKRASKPSSDAVTTTTISSSSPSALSASSSPSNTSTSAHAFSATTLDTAVAPLLSSTSENGGNSNVSSSSKPDKRRPSVLPPCRVCCSKASGLHYGVVTCEACNGFFRRSLKRGAIYMCSKEKKCDVNGKKRGECSHCRYQKCLFVGMSKSAVKTGRYSDKTRLAYAIETESHNKTNFLLNEYHGVKTMTSELLNIHELDVDGPACKSELDLFEKHYNVARLDVTRKWVKWLKSRIQKSGPALVEHPITTGDWVSGELCLAPPACAAYLKGHKVEFKVLGCKHLRQSSCQVPSTDNTAKVMSLYNKSISPEMPTTTFPDYLSDHGLSKSKRRSIILEQWLRQYLKFTKDVPGFNLLPISDQTKLVRAAWHEIWLLEVCRDITSGMKVSNGNSGVQKDIQMILGKDYTDVSYRLSARLEKLKIKDDQLQLVQMLCLTDPSRCRLDAPEQVNSLHWLINQCLIQEFEISHPDEPNALCEIHTLLTELKTDCQQPLFPSNNNIHSSSLTQEMPLLQEMLS